MTSRFFFVLPMLLSMGWLLGGCSSTGQSLLSYDPDKPQVLLPGAEVDQAKSLAMGSAVTKGWKVVESSDNGIVVRRPLDAAAAQSITGEPVSTASIEVRSDFFQRQEGVTVVVGAALFANKGSKSERSIDFTDSYKDDLNRSLISLRQSWDENRWRVASATPPVPNRTAVSEEELAARDTPGNSGEPVADSGTGPALVASAGSATASPPSPAESPIAASTSAAAAPIENRAPLPTFAPVAPGAAPTKPANDMMALNRKVDPGVWAYYAEHYAKIRGCQLSGQGAVLEQKQPEYEIHRVYCDNEKTFLVKCNAGTCRGME